MAALLEKQTLENENDKTFPAAEEAIIVMKLVLTWKAEVAIKGRIWGGQNGGMCDTQCPDFSPD